MDRNTVYAQEFPFIQTGTEGFLLWETACWHPGKEELRLRILVCGREQMSFALVAAFEHHNELEFH